MAKNRGRDVSISRGTLPLTTIRAITPLGVPFTSQTPIVTPIISRSAIRNRLQPDITPYATPPNRVAKNATGNNLYTPTPVSKEISTCKNRSVRKQVIFATGKSGRNGMKHARYTQTSKVKC